MTPRERWLATINFNPVDRLVFWPKIVSISYVLAQREPFRKMSIRELHSWMGSDSQFMIPDYLRTDRKKSSVEVSEADHKRTTKFITPLGSAEMVMGYDAYTQSWHPLKMPIQDRKDIEIMTEWYLDSQTEIDRDQLDKSRQFTRDLKEQSLVAQAIGESPLMRYVEYLAGVENGHYLIFDYPDEVGALFDAMHSVLRRRSELAAATSPADILYFIENTSTTLISVEQYREYCMPHISDYARIIRESGRLFGLHMCGHLKALLPDLAKLDVNAFEAFTSPTLGNTTLLDGRTTCPDKCLIGGTNAVLWTRSASEIIETIGKDLDALPDHRGIVLSSGGEMPPLCPPEIIKEVGTWVKNYPVRM